MWVMLGEIFPNNMRVLGLGVAGLAQWLANFLVTITFPILLAAGGLVLAYSLYAFFALISVLFVIYLVTETKGTKLENV